jgi:hypothetical protein
MHARPRGEAARNEHDTTMDWRLYKQHSKSESLRKVCDTKIRKHFGDKIGDFALTSNTKTKRGIISPFKVWASHGGLLLHVILTELRKLPSHRALRRDTKTFIST